MQRIITQLRSFMGRTVYNNNYFGLTFGITWFDDRFSYFAGDGTPLAEYFDGYSKLEIATMDSMFDIMLIQDGDTGNEEQNENILMPLAHSLY